MTAAEMLNEWYENVHEASYDSDELRISLIQEEADEAVEAIQELDRLHIAKELADLVYVAYGAAEKYGIPLDACLAEVHRSNMTKIIGGVKRDPAQHHKVIKGPHYEEADIRRTIAEADRRYDEAQRALHRGSTGRFGWLRSAARLRLAGHGG